MQGDRQRTLVAGCDGYIQKPINVDAFPGEVAEFLGGKRERVEGREEGVYLRELNQRLVYRLLNQVEELKRLNQHFVRRASQLADLHRAVQDITSELGVAPMLERLLNALAQAIGTTSLRLLETATPPEYKNLDALGKVDLILVSHGHMDHSADAPALAKKNNGQVQVDQVNVLATDRK